MVYLYFKMHVICWSQVKPNELFQISADCDFYPEYTSALTGSNFVHSWCVFCICFNSQLSLDHSHSSTTMRLKMALWFLPISLGFRPKQIYWPPSSKVMLDSMMETLFSWFIPTNVTRSRYTDTWGSTPSDGITDSHTWQNQKSFQSSLENTWLWVECRSLRALPSAGCRCC